LPFSRCRFAVPVIAVSVTALPLPYVPWLVGVDDWLASYGTNGKIELDPIATEERLRQLFAVYGYNGTEFSYLFFLQNNGILQRRNGNGTTATEWRKPVMGHQRSMRWGCTKRGRFVPLLLFIALCSPIEIGWRCVTA